MASTGHNIKVDHNVLDEVARKINNHRSTLSQCLYEIHGELDEVGEAMASRAGDRLLERCDNFVKLYFDRYVDTMGDHAIYLNKAAIEYEAADTEMKSQAESALAKFDHV